MINMAHVKKLSTYLNRYYSYFKIRDAKSELILNITFDFIKDAEKKIYKQPSIALRSIKVEMIDIHVHYDRLVNELKQYLYELDKILSKGPKLNKIDLEKAHELENKRDVLAEFIYLLEDAMAYMTRMLLEHYSQLEIEKPFLDKFAKYLGPFDWMSKRADRFRNEFIIKDGNDLKTGFFKPEITKEANRLIENNEVIKALDLLLSNVRGQVVEKELILLKHQWADLENRRNLGIQEDDSIRVTRNKIVYGILSFI